MLFTKEYFVFSTEVGIYKRKQENKKTTFDQESDQEKNKKERKHALDQESDQEKMKKLSFFLDHFLGRVLVVFLFFFFFLLSCFLL